MNVKQTILALVAIAGIGGVLFFMPTAVHAATCGGIDTAIISCDEQGGEDIEDNGVWGLLLLTINIMTAGIGILAVGGIVYGAILYTTSSDSQEQTKQAKDIIRNVAIGLLAYAGIYLFLNFLIPGGIFN